MKRSGLLALLVLGVPGVCFGQTGYSISGGLSNFDVHNRCDDPCDEFEVEIEGIHPEDVVHTYHNGNYGAPTVTLSADGLATIIDYRNPQHLTAVGGVEHFGVSLTQLSPYTPIHVRWMVNGHAATVNGQVPVEGGGSAPATQPVMPSITSEVTWSPDEGDGVICTVTNNDPVLWVWVKRRASVSSGSVTLEALMPNDPVVTGTVQIDATPFLLGPGDSVTSVSDLVEIEENQSVVFAAEYYQDLGVVGPFSNEHALGPEMGNVMTASLASPGDPCSEGKPVIVQQPGSVEAAAGHEVELSADVESNDLALSYQWMKEGLPLSNGGHFSGVTTGSLRIDHLQAETEGFYSVRAYNSCGAATSQSALVFITGHNAPPDRPGPCAADLGSQGGMPGSDGLLDNNDFIVFIDLFFNGDPGADVGSQGGVSGSDGEFDNNDFIAFINAFFAGC